MALFVSLMATLWGGFFLLHSLQETSLEPIEDIFLTIACALTVAVVVSAIQTLFGAKQSSASSDGVDGAASTAESAKLTEAFARARISQAAITVDAEGSQLDRARKSFHRLNLFLAWSGVAGIFALFPLARYVQVLSPSSTLWTATATLTAAGTLYFFVFLEPRLRPAFSSDNERKGTFIFVPVMLLVASNMALRLVNATPGLVLSPVPQFARVTGKHASSHSHRGARYATLTADLEFEDGGSTSVYVSAKVFHSIHDGDTVEVQRRIGLLGMSWCLNNCFVPR